LDDIKEDIKEDSKEKNILDDKKEDKNQDSKEKNKIVGKKEDKKEENKEIYKKYNKEEKKEEYKNLSKKEEKKEGQKINLIKYVKDVSGTSTKEDVAKFFELRFNLNQEISKKFINEYISGDILPNLSLNDFKSLGLNLDSIIDWNKYYEENKSKFINNNLKKEISFNANYEEVKEFLESYLDYKGNIKNLNGKRLFELNEDSMKKIGMKIGQRRRLIKYINYVNENKNNNQKNNKQKI